MAGYERIHAGEVRAGDRVARARTHSFQRVVEVKPGERAVWLVLEGGWRARPLKTARWWREVER